MIQLSFLIAICGLIGFSTALTIGTFQNQTAGIWDEWNSKDPANVNQGRFGLVASNGDLWMISRRLFRKNLDNPWDPASRGGIVSTLKTSTNVWSHDSYPSQDEDKYGDKLFSLNGRLFMLTYEISGSPGQKSIVYHKLFFWDNNAWFETPFEIDPAASNLAPNEITHLSLSVPDQSGKIAYCVASAHAYAQRGSEMVFSKLEMEFRGSVPVKATLKPVARENSLEPSAVVFTAKKGDILYAFIQNFYSEGYVPITDFAYTVDLKNGRVSNVSISGARPPMDFENERIFQAKNDVLLVGGTQVYLLGQVREVSDIWSLNLDTMEWKGTNKMIPDGAGSTPAYDQQTGNLYLAGLKDGVSVAKVNL